MSKWKKAILLSGMLLTCTTIQAQWQYNWLAGASLGNGERRGNVNYFIYDLTNGSVAEFSRNQDNTGWFGGILGGYQARCRAWLVGGELSIDWPHRHETNHFNRGGILFGTTTTYDPLIALTGRIGYQITNFLLPYVRAGVETTEISLNVNGQFARFPTFYLEGDKRIYNFIAGVGAEIPILWLTGVSFRVEYNYISKGTTASVNDFFTGIPDDVIVNVDTKPKAKLGKASLVYNFI